MRDDENSHQAIKDRYQEMRTEIEKATGEQRRLNAELNEMNLKLTVPSVGYRFSLQG